MEIVSEKRLRVDEFWSWFSQIAGALSNNKDDPSLLEQIDRRVRELEPRLSWEIGPGWSESSQLVISPNLNQDLRETAKGIIASAPVIQGWEFHSTKQPKKWDYKFELQGGQQNKRLLLDASTWNFVLLRYPDGIHEILLEAKELPLLTDGQKWQAAAVVLESILGENVLLDGIDFDLVTQLEPQFEKKRRPIHELRDAFKNA